MKNLIRKYRNRYRRRYNPLVEPDEIFLDSKNLPDFNTQQFEGTLEYPIRRSSLGSVGGLFLIALIVFASRLWYLQITNGSVYKHQSERNSLGREPIFAARGNIYDRNNVPLVWNNTVSTDMPWGERSYIQKGGFSHVLGYVDYPTKDRSGNYWQTEIIGKDGVEKVYNDDLAGANGWNIVERDIAGKVQSGSIVDEPVPGKNLILSVDARLQGELSRILSEQVATHGFRSASGIMMDATNGEIISITNVPEYNSGIMSLRKDTAKIRQYLTDKRSPLINRAVGGLFVPGSIVKPYIALEVLNQAVIDPLKKLESRGYISIPNPYFPDRPSIFRDYNPDNGWVDIRHAIAVSSNIFFMKVTGGYKEQKGIGIYNLNTALSRFGFTSKTGVDLPGEKFGTLPNPEWKAERFPGEPWRVGDTYNTAIGQYGVQVTPIEIARSLSAVANRGTLVTPHVLKDLKTETKKITDVPDSYYTIVHEGMQLGATIGTGQILSRLPFSAGSKTGTAQVGVGGKNINSWMTVFFPYEKPKYVFVVMLNDGPSISIASAQRSTYEFLDWVALNAPEYTRTAE
ncbi:MAG: hypothetical protein KBC17_01705 [Candidatus Pacebacteria bacterium]|nr:hypothetical protein [Candidatus Paceibacterota bacterium]